MKVRGQQWSLTGIEILQAWVVVPKVVGKTLSNNSHCKVW